MLERNRYFIVNVTNPNISQIYGLVVEDEYSQSFNNDNTKVIVKLPLKDLENHTCLDGITEYTNSEILTEMQNPEWQKDETI